MKTGIKFFSLVGGARYQDGRLADMFQEVLEKWLSKNPGVEVKDIEMTANQDTFLAAVMYTETPARSAAPT